MKTHYSRCLREQWSRSLQFRSTKNIQSHLSRHKWYSTSYSRSNFRPMWRWYSYYRSCKLRNCGKSKALDTWQSNFEVRRRFSLLAASHWDDTYNSRAGGTLALKASMQQRIPFKLVFPIWRNLHKEGHNPRRRILAAGVRDARSPAVSTRRQSWSAAPQFGNTALVRLGAFWP